MSDTPEYPDFLKDLLVLTQTDTEDFPPLLHGEIHLWTASLLGSTDQVERMRSVLSREEKTRAAYFKFESKQRSYILTQAVLRILVSAYMDMEPPDLVFDVQKKGKPFLTKDPSLFFNISNSSDLCVYAFSRDGEVGIDIERIRDLPDLDQLIHKNLTSREKAYVLKDPAYKLSRFFRFWTYKEAYLKAIGEGMRLTPENLEFSEEEGTIRLLSVKYGFDATDWHFKGFTREGEYTGTLVYAGKGIVIREMGFAYNPI